MTQTIPAVAAKWLSFHVFLGDAWNPFLAFYFRPAFDAKVADRHIKRFFFIQYSEGGLHLRMRFLPGRGRQSEMITTWMEELVHRFRQERNLPAGQCFLQKHHYHRSELYFGETRASVYAELLNEQTSYLALRFIAGPGGGRSLLLVKLVCALHMILEKVARDPCELRLLVAASRQFAHQAIIRLGLPLPLETHVNLERQLCRALQRSLPQLVPILEKDVAVQSLITLLRRLRRSPVLYEVVGPHALHLFCNKVGLSFIEELYLFSSLLRLTGGG